MSGTDLTCELLLASEAPELEISDSHLRVAFGAEHDVLLAFACSIVSARATARHSKKRSVLVISAPLLDALPQRSEAPAMRQLRLCVRGLGRGEHVLNLAPLRGDANGRDDAAQYVLVSRSGDFASVEGGYGWCHVLAAGSSARVTIDAAEWLWECDEVRITHGVLQPGDSVPTIDAETVQLGVHIDAERVAHAVGVQCVFVPEESRLPTDELRAACRLYDDAFASADGDALSRQYTQQRPPPPKWEAADGQASVVDTYYTTLTYGEAEFVPLYELLRRVGVPDGSVVLDLGSGTGRMVAAVCLCFPLVRMAVGIELVPTLHVCADSVLAALREGATKHGLPMAPARAVEGDVLTTDWCDADLLLCTSLCFTDVLVTAVQRRTRELKLGARVVCMQSTFDEAEEAGENGAAESVAEGAKVAWLRPVPVREAEPANEVAMQMSFGHAKFYVFERV